MGILSRFGDIISANINALLDNAEDPAKMIDEYLRKAADDLAEVKKETAAVMAEESRTKRELDKNNEEIQRYMELAKKALGAGNEDDARVFLAKKQGLESTGQALQAAYNAAKANADKMRELHNKLVDDIATLDARRDAIKAKVSAAKAQQSMNELGASASNMEGTLSAFDRMEQKADRMLDMANATAELNTEPVDAAEALEDKYSSAPESKVDDELAALKASMGL